MVNLDAFRLPFADSCFDAVISFRFIRHLRMEARATLYQSVWRVLRPGGYLVFDVCNYIQHKDQIKYRKVYDELYTREQIIHEMTTYGFEVEQLVGMLYLPPKFFGLRRLGFSERFLANVMVRIEKRIRDKAFLLPMAYLWVIKCRKPTAL